VAVLAGSDAMVKVFEEKSETLVHASPPSIAHVRAAEHALAVNRKHGEALRWRLAQLVRRFRKRLKQMGFSSTGGLFPVQTLAPDNNAETFHKHLLDRGVRTVLHQKRNGQGASLSFLITARHTPDELDYAVNVLADLANKKDWQRTTREANHEIRI
jgi:8-amino-7-oxononanoate synthase